MNLVSLANMHVLAVLPLVWCGEFSVIGVVMVAPEAEASSCSQTPRVILTMVIVHNIRGWTFAILIVLARRAVLSAEVPVHIHWAQTSLPIWGQDRRTTSGVDGALVARGDIDTRLFQGIEHPIFRSASDIIEILVSRRSVDGLLAHTVIVLELVG
jgi:hypothetical protein